MKSELKKLIDRALPVILTQSGASDLKNFDYDVEIPKNKAFGDLAINLAMKLGKILKKNPVEMAQTCQKAIEIEIQKDPLWTSRIKQINVVKPGFINIFFTDKFTVEQLLRITREGQTFGRSNFGNGKKVLVEFVSANPTGPLTIAHGRQAAIGDTLARILNEVGYDVRREFYLNDGGRQIRLLGESLWVRYQALFNRSAALPEDGYQGQYLIDLATQLKQEQGESLLSMEPTKAIEATTAYAVKHILDGIKSDLKDMRVVFDEYYSEKTLYTRNKIETALQDLKQKGYCYESEGALWFKSTEFGDDKDRVLTKQTGEFTYLSPDIAYHKEKFERGYEWLINLWGPDHHGYIPRLKAACQALGHSPDQIKVLIVQLTTLYRSGEPVRMSTRAGEFVTLKELMDEVGVDATRFFFLMRRAESHLDFDLELAKKKSDENPVYYLQYAHARISSILAFAKEKYPSSEHLSEANLSLITEPEAMTLIKKMLEFPMVLQESAQMTEPYRLADYLRELATTFHQYYAAHRVVGDDEALTCARLLLAKSAQLVLRNGLRTLGVDAPDQM